MEISGPIWEPYKSRREEHGVQLYGALKIARTDRDAEQLVREVG